MRILVSWGRQGPERPPFVRTAAAVLVAAAAGLGSRLAEASLPPGPMPVPLPAAGLATTDMVMRAFDPLINLVQALSYPLCFLLLSAGCLLIMAGYRARGLDMIRWAAVGYILVQLAPAIMRVLVDVGMAMRQAQAP
ncbi:hypothetical protein [Thermaerobacter litoralis]